jgi:quercetin dioxygenase-like cupin family protein
MVPRLALWLCLFPALLLAQDQTPVDITSEPHHHLLLENEKVRVFEVTIGPHAEMPLTRHEHNFLVITLADSEIASWAEGQAGVITYRYNQNDIRFFYGGPARALRNDTPNEYHNLTVEFLNPKINTYGYQADAGRWEYGSNALPPPVDSHAAFSDVMPLGEARVRDVQLLPDDEYAAPETEADELFIFLTDIELKTADQRIRKSQGELLWIAAGRKKKLANNAAAPARMVVLELR